jgi:DNA-binding MarR family transcriptional regulator
MPSYDRLDDTVIVMSAASRSLRRELTPLAWVILEDVALDAELEEGRLVAHTSARQVAEHLRVDPGTAARALRILRERGFLVLEREKGPAGRFGLSVYVVRTVPGMTIITPGVAGSCAVSPSKVRPYVVNTELDRAHMVPQTNGSASTVEIETIAPDLMLAYGTPPARPALQVPGQQILELDGGIA